MSMSTLSSRLGSSQHLASELESAIRRGQYAIGSKLPSIRTIAQQHSVSVGTVQRALNQLEAMDLISSSPRRRGLVKDFRQQSSLRRSDASSAILPATTLHLGIVHPDSFPTAIGESDDHESWTGHISRAIHAAANAAHYDTLTMATPSQQSRETELLNRLQHLRQSIAGLVIFQLQQLPLLAAGLDEMQIPWVSIDRPAPNATHNFVSSDFTRAGYVVGQAFAACAFERVLLMLSDFKAFRSSAELSAGFMQAYLEQGHSPAGIAYRICTQASEQSGYELARRFLLEGGKPQGILTTGDRTALGAIRACKEFGLRCPEDVSVVGGTGLEISRYTAPTLAVIQQPMQQIGQSAVKMLLEMVQSKSRRVPGTLFACDFIQRQSLCLSTASNSKLVSDWKRQLEN